MFWIIWRSRDRTKHINTVRIGTCHFPLPFNFRKLLRCNHTDILPKAFSNLEVRREMWEWTVSWRCLKPFHWKLTISTCWAERHGFEWLRGLGHRYLQWTPSTNTTNFKLRLNWSGIMLKQENLHTCVSWTMPLACWNLPQAPRNKTLLRTISEIVKFPSYDIKLLKASLEIPIHRCFHHTQFSVLLSASPRLKSFWQICQSQSCQRDQSWSHI